MKILILSSSTGGGHDMRARSLTQWAEKITSPERPIETATFSTLESGSPTYRFGVELYNAIQKKVPWFHHLYFTYLEQAQMHRYGDLIQQTDKFVQILHDFKPDIVVSVHAHLNHGYFKIIKKELGIEIPCVTYCGELFGGYGFSQLWANPDADYFYGAVHACTQEARNLGYDHEKSHTAGFLLHPSFYDTPHEDELVQFQKKLGIDRTKFRLILATGANAANNHISILRELEKKKLPIQVIVLCGKNDETLSQVKDFARSTHYLSVLPLAYFSEMTFLMKSSSAIIARPGTGTTSEAIMANCPIIFNGMGGIMPQEWITMKFAQSKNFSSYFKTPKKCAKLVADLVYKENKLLHEQEALLAIRPTTTPADLLEHLESLSQR